MSNSPIEKDVILANFQACSEIDDVGKAFTILEDSNWDLQYALSVASAHNDSQMHHSIASHSGAFQPIFPIVSPQEIDIIDLASPMEEVSTASSVNATAGSSQPSSFLGSFLQPKVIDVNIKIVSDCLNGGNSFPLELPLSTTVSELKTLLYQLVGIQPCNQNLQGFTEPVTDESTITPNLLPKNMVLSCIVNSKAQSFHPASSSIDDSEMAGSSDECIVFVSVVSGREFRLPYGKSKLIRDIKMDVFDLTSINMRHQVWTGWPAGITDDSTLGMALRDNSNIIRVTVSSLANKSTETASVSTASSFSTGESSAVAPKVKRREEADEGNSIEEDQEEEEFEDASELLPADADDDFLAMCIADTSRAAVASLMPEAVVDEAAGAIAFAEAFEARYGLTNPLFYRGCLADALSQSVMQPPRTRRPLVVYAHHDRSVLANVFCSEALCSSAVHDFISENFIAWGWDLTHESNKALLIRTLTTELGSVAATTVRCYGVERLPALFVLSRRKGSVEILSIIGGTATVDEVVSQLVSALETFECERGTEMVAVKEAEARASVKAEQDEAYLESLAVDRAKEEAKRSAEKQETEERMRKESFKEQELAIKEAVRASLELSLPAEPESGGNNVIALRFRPPPEQQNGQVFVRNFTANTKLQVVLNYLCVRGYPQDEYKCLTSWPRRCLTTLESQSTLAELKMPKQETIILEERHDGSSD